MGYRKRSSVALLVAGVLVVLGWWFLSETENVGSSEIAPVESHVESKSGAPTPPPIATRREVEGAPALPSRTLRFVVRSAASGNGLAGVELIYVVKGADEGVRAWSALGDARGRCELLIDEARTDPVARDRFGSWLRGQSSLLLAHAAGHVWHIERPFDPATIADERVIELKRGIQLRGGVTGRGAARPVADATIYLGGTNQIGDVYTKLDRIEHATDGDGIFEIGLAEGESHALGFSGIELIAIAGKDAAQALLALDEAVDLRIEADMASLRIDVRDEGGRPVPSATATAISAHGFGDLASARKMAVYYPRELQSKFLFTKARDRNGDLWFEQLPRLTSAFRFAVEVKAAGYVTRTLDVRFEGEEREKRVTATLVASRGFVLHGVVRDPQGNPVAGARIESRDCPTVTTDSDGRYRLEVATLGRNDWWYPRVNKDGYLEAMKNLDLTGKGPDVEVDFKLWKPASIAGRVIDSMGLPVPSASMRLHYIEDAPNDISREVKSDAAGAFRIDHAAEGTWSFEVSAVPPEGASYELKRFQGLVDGGTSDYEVVLERSEASASIDVRVLRTSLGEPVVIEAADVIELSSRDIYRIIRAPRIDSSHVVAERLTVGRYRISVIAGSDFGSVEVEVPNPSSSVAVDLVIGVKGRVEGRVVSAGRSDTGCSIWLQPSRGFQFGSSGPWQRLNAPGMIGVLQEIATADDGTFAFEAPVGSYRLRTVRYRTKPSLEGVTEIEVRAGDTTNVEIQAYHAAMLAFTLRGIPAGVALDAVVVDAVGSERRLWNSSHDESERGALQETLFLKPGEVRWRIELTARTSGSQRVSWCPPRDGKADLVAGEVVKVEIDFSKP